MKVIIVGCSRVGAMVAQVLVSDGHQVTVVDIDRNAFSRLGPDFPGEMVLGNGIDEDVLRKAGIEQAEGFASLTNGDNRNIMAAQIAQKIFRVNRVITRIYDPIRAEVYGELGLESLCPTTLGASIVQEFFSTGHNPAHSGALVPGGAGTPG
jgi:trk system potassium uptake protein TrkA